MYELNNDERQYFGLKEVDKSWIIKEFNNGKIYINKMRVSKVIHLHIHENSYTEIDYDEEITEDNSYLLPTKKNGKKIKLNVTNLLKRMILP